MIVLTYVLIDLYLAEGSPCQPSALMAAPRSKQLRAQGIIHSFSLACQFPAGQHVSAAAAPRSRPTAANTVATAPTPCWTLSRAHAPDRLTVYEQNCVTALARSTFSTTLRSCLMKATGSRFQCRLDHLLPIPIFCASVPLFPPSAGTHYKITPHHSRSAGEEAEKFSCSTIHRIHLCSTTQ